MTTPLLSSRARFRRSADARNARTGDDLILLHLRRGTYYALNETGAFAWGCLDGSATLGEIRAALEEKFAVAGDQASADLDELIAALLAEELVEAVDLAAGED